jgi:hypothetical protein
MKRIIFILALIFAALVFPDFSQAQTISKTVGTAYSTQNPSAAPNGSRPQQLWLNTETGILWAWDKSARAWFRQNNDLYGEMAISDDTLTLAFAAVTADTLEGFTAGQLHGFSLGGDHSLIYSGDRQGRFLVEYSVSFTFAEAGTLTSYLKQNTDIVYKSRRRQIVSTAGNNVTSSASCILVLNPGDKLSLWFFPTTHTGSDDLTVHEGGVTVTQLR